MQTVNPFGGHKLLVANRGEIAVRIIRTAKSLGLPTVSIYTFSDTLSTHVSSADESIPLSQYHVAHDAGEAEAKAYTTAETIVSVCLKHAVTMLHPGYGFLSENADFALRVTEAGIIWLGPRPDIIRTMGLKHEARDIAARAGVPIIPGSPDLLDTVSNAIESTRDIGYPIALKATAGGGGLGIVMCNSEEDLKAQFASAQQRAETLFGTNGVFIERYFPAARHIEIQVFGNGLGDVVHMGERECSVQRRHQKIIEESPSPFVECHPGLREEMCTAALNLCRAIRYNSAGTIEFLVDDNTGSFYFLEMNTRIQVEHPVTETIHPGLDLVKLMIEQGIAEHMGYGTNGGIRSDAVEMQQETYDQLRTAGQILHRYAIEGRIYAENPARGFVPCPGLLQNVELNSKFFDWLRVESWITTGVSVTPFFDGLLCKLIVTGRSRDEAITRFQTALDMCKIDGPPNNIEYLGEVMKSEPFRRGQATTMFLANFPFHPRALTVLSPGMECTAQDLPGRRLGSGVPCGGAMDPLALSAGNILVGNSSTMEGLEIIVLPNMGFEVEFGAAAVVSVTGKNVAVTVDGLLAEMWSKLVVPRGGRLRFEAVEAHGYDSGFRIYLCIRGGLPGVPPYLGSKSTSMGLGGYQGRSLRTTDQLALGHCGPQAVDNDSNRSVPPSLIPKYSRDWIIYVLPGPHDDDEFITPADQRTFYTTKWNVSLASNRLGIRLESNHKLDWARTDGGEGGSHPSNILDNGYALGTVNVNGDTPVILTADGPDMGGYVSFCTVASAEMWKLGQVQPGNTIQFVPIAWTDSVQLRDISDVWLDTLHSPQTALPAKYSTSTPWDTNIRSTAYGPILFHEGHGQSMVKYRQAGDSAILVEFGAMSLDFSVRARIHAFQTLLERVNPIGIGSLCPCVRSIMCHYDAAKISQSNFLTALHDTQNKIPATITGMTFPGRKITFPIVLDDPWNREALDRYMKTVRQKAVYLPSNIEYLAKNNGLAGGSEEALRRLVGCDWLVIGVGFYLGCPFLVPIDPRCRLIGQKMNPSRTFTPRGAIGIAGPVAAIYPVESPGGYQLYGRTLPTWQTWGKGVGFDPAKPWLLRPFDQIHFEIVSPSTYTELEKKFDSGTYEFQVEPAEFSMAEYAKFTASISKDITYFRKQQANGSALEGKREREYLSQWDIEKQSSSQLSKTQVASFDNMIFSATITAPLFASVWKILFQPGDVIQAPDDILMILEAMKMEIPVQGGHGNVGKSVGALGKGITEGVIVHPGDVLFLLS